MKPVQVLLRASMAGGMAFIALSYLLVENWAVALGVAALGALWAVFHTRFAWVSYAGFILLIGAGVFSLTLDAPGIWAGLGGIAVLSAWDLDRFSWRLHQIKTLQTDRLLKRHLRALALVDGMALVVLVLSQTVRLKMSFVVLFFLALMAVYFLTMALRWMITEKPGGREEDKAQDQ